jgi:hypothetical protein
MNTDRIDQQTREKTVPRKTRRNERGYALVGLMGVMMFALILTTATAPSVKFESQREREEEMLWRGQQIAIALQRYAVMRGGQYPTDLNDLVEGIEVGAKKIRLLRPSALCDPMMPCDPESTNWRLVHPGDPLVKELLDAYVAAQQRGNVILPPPPANLVLFAQMGATKLPGQAADTQLDGNIGPGNPPVNDPAGPPPPSGGPGISLSDGTGNSLSDKAPIIGVVSRRADKMFRNYFGIEQYDHTLFFPGVPVVAGGIINPMSLLLTMSAPQNPTSNCPYGGVMINGKCWGGLYPGKYCRDPQTGATMLCPK